MTRRRGWRSRPLWRKIADIAVVVVITVVIAGGLELLPGSLTSGNMIVVDGDSLRPRDGSSDIRLEGIDAPELGQQCRNAAGKTYRCGREARDHLRALIADNEVKCRVRDVDRYERSVAVCTAGENQLNSRMVEDGWALSYRTGEFGSQQRNAKQSRKGLWQGEFELPEVWRSVNRSDASGSGAEPD
jgi:endonuclease YncB( thermonuclease family)